MKNWKTTMSGVVGAVAVAVWPIVNSGAVDWSAVRTAAVLAVVGWFAKDAGVSGMEK